MGIPSSTVRSLRGGVWVIASAARPLVAIPAAVPVMIAISLVNPTVV